MKKVIFLVGIVIILFFAFKGFLQGENSRRRWVVYREEQHEHTVFSTEFTEQGEFCVVDDALSVSTHLISPDNYLVFVDFKRREFINADLAEYYEYEMFDLVYYDLRTLQEVRRYSLLDIMKPYLKECGFLSFDSHMRFRKYKGKYHFILSMVPREGGLQWVFALDLEEGKAVKIEYEDIEIEREYPPDAWLYKNTSLYNPDRLFFDVGSYTDVLPEMKMIKVSGALLPERNSVLYSMFPGLKKYIGDGEKAVRIYLNNWNIYRMTRLILNDGEEPDLSGLEVKESWEKGRDEWVEEKNYGVYYKNGERTPIKDEDLQSFLEGYREYIKAQEESPAAQ